MRDYLRNTITFTCTRKYPMYKDIDNRTQLVLKEDSMPLSRDPENGLGFLEHFKRFCLMLGYHHDCVERIVYLQENEEVVEKDEEKVD